MPPIDESDPKYAKMTAKEVRSLKECFAAKSIYLSFNCHESVTLRLCCSFPETPKTKEQLQEEADQAAAEGRAVPKQFVTAKQLKQQIKEDVTKKTAEFSKNTDAYARFMEDVKEKEARLNERDDASGIDFVSQNA